MIGIVDNNLITSHGNHILVFDLDPPGVAEVEFVCNVKGSPGSANYIASLTDSSNRKITLVL